jgi:5-methylcytosine-specific restriction endonuclease McrBC GTP-binding regulatory subunit McrB
MSTLTTKVGELVGKSENLGESFFKTSEKITKTTASPATTAGTTELKKEMLSPKTPETTTTEMKFTNPIEIKVTLSGFPSGMKEEDIKKMIEEGKFSQEIVKAITEADKQKTSQK